MCIHLILIGRASSVNFQTTGHAHVYHMSVMYHTLSGILLICHLAFKMVWQDRKMSKSFERSGSLQPVWTPGWERNVPDVMFSTVNTLRGWKSWQLVQVCPLHSDGLIPVRDTATQCPSAELKIVTGAKNSGELCSLKAALTWARPNCIVILYTIFFPQRGDHVGNSNISSAKKKSFFLL